VLTEKDVCERTGLDPGTVLRLHELGLLPGFAISRILLLRSLSPGQREALIDRLLLVRWVPRTRRLDFYRADELPLDPHEAAALIPVRDMIGTV
jgi:hypothetical protein